MSFDDSTLMSVYIELSIGMYSLTFLKLFSGLFCSFVFVVVLVFFFGSLSL